jgi:hypothetical protein
VGMALNPSAWRAIANALESFRRAEARKPARVRRMRRAA